LKSGRRIIRCPISPRSSVAPTVRPTPVFFNRRFIRRYTKAWVLPVITVRRRISPNPNLVRATAVRPTPPSCSLQATSSRRARLAPPPPVLRRPPRSPPATRAAHSRRFRAHPGRRPHLGFGRVATSGRAPPPGITGDLPEERRHINFIHSHFYSSTSQAVVRFSP
jgi:hypothetical protein